MLNTLDSIKLWNENSSSKIGIFLDSSLSNAKALNFVLSLLLRKDRGRNKLFVKTKKRERAKYFHLRLLHSRGCWKGSRSRGKRATFPSRRKVLAAVLSSFQSVFFKPLCRVLATANTDFFLSVSILSFLFEFFFRDFQT